MTKTALEEEKERLQNELEEARKREEEQSKEQNVEEEARKDEEAPEPEEKPAEKAEEHKDKTEEKAEAVEQADEDEHPAKKRLKRKEEKRRAEELEARLMEAHARIAELSRPREEATRPVSDEPNRIDDPQAWTEWKVQQQDRELSEFKQWKAQQEQARAYQERIRQAENEIIAFENQVRDKLPAYDEAKSYLAHYEAFNIRRENPSLTQEQLADAVKMKLMTRAAYFLKEGYENPIEALYEDAKMLGFNPKKQDQGEKKRPDLDKVAKNHARNAGMAGAAAGSGSGEVTPRYVAENMTVEETAKLFAQMSAEEKRKFYQRLA